MYVLDMQCVCMLVLDRPYDEERHILKVKNDKEKQIAKIEESAKKMKQSK